MKTKSLPLIFMAFCLSYACQAGKANKDSLANWRKRIENASGQKTRHVAHTYYKIGQYYSHNESKLDSSVYYLKLAKKIFEEKGPRRSVGTSSYTIGISYAHQQDKKNAIKYLTIAENIFIEIKDTATLFHASLARADQLPAEQKISKLKEIAKLAKAHGTVGAAISCYGNIGQGFMSLDLHDSAIYYLKKQFDLNNNNTDKRSDYKRKTLEHNYFTCLSLGITYQAKKDYKQANNYYRKSYNFAKSISNKFHGVSGAAGKLIQLADEWEKLDPKQYKIHMGAINKLALLREAEQVASESQSYGGAVAVTKGFIAYFKAKNNKDSVIAFQQKLLKLRESQYEDEQIQATAKFSEELKTADKEKEIIQLNADKKIASATANRNKIIFFLILLGLLSSIYFIVKRIKQRNQLEQEARDKNFRSKLSSDLHDDVGTILTSLSMQSELLEMKASESNKSTVSKIAGMSRDATRRMRDTVWAIDSRKDNVMDLAYRMIDFAEDILEPKDVEFQLTHNIEGKNDKISAELRQNIFLIFKEALTNAAKYGSGDLVTASLQKENDNLNLSVSNQTDKEIKINEVSGLGLSNIEKRTREMNGEFQIKNEENQFILHLNFPL
jgi:signal transduction histidine kinase